MSRFFKTRRVASSSRNPNRKNLAAEIKKLAMPVRVSAGRLRAP
jgi:hypothetical protein